MKRNMTFPKFAMTLFLFAVATFSSGCASLTNPVANGVPVRRLPEHLLDGPTREDLRTVPLTALSMDAPESYLLGEGDVIGVFVDGVLPLAGPDAPVPNPPVYFPSQIDPLGVGLSPSLGYPIPVRKEGNIQLPMIGAVNVDGKTIEDADQIIREAYIASGILPEGKERIIVTLMQPRSVRVKVFRQEVGGFATGGRGGVSTNAVKRGAGYVLHLRANENDVSSALVETGGLPGLDAYAGIYIFRKANGNRDLDRHIAALEPGQDPMEFIDADGIDVVHIPTRWPLDAPLPFDPEDVVLNDGDIVLVEARPIELFYTGGLLPAGEFVLPRDYDLDVLEAIALVQGPLLNGAFAGNNLAGALLQQGLGSPSPSLLTVVRQTPDGRQVPIKVDLNRALRDRRERILVHPGDMLLLQQTPGEAIANYFSNVFNVTIFGDIFDRSDAVGAATLSVPN